MQQAPYFDNKMHQNMSLGLSLFVLTDIRLIAVIVAEAFACVLSGIIAYFFNKKNKFADRYAFVLEGHQGFRYTT